MTVLVDPARVAALPRLEAFDRLPSEAAARSLAQCCAARRWVTALAAGRPYGSVDALYEAAGRQLAALEWPDVREALAAQPRLERWIGGLELARAATAYEAKFGFVFLIRTPGRDPGQLLKACRDRLGHDELTEQPAVRGELAQVVRLRLDRMLARLDPAPDPADGPRRSRDDWGAA